MIGGRSPKMTDDTSIVLSEAAIKTYLLYYPQLKVLFTTHIHQNYNVRPKKIISWKEIEQKNVGMTVSAFLKMCHHFSLMTVTMSIEELCKFIKLIIPPITPEEFAYDEKNVLNQIYY